MQLSTFCIKCPLIAFMDAIFPSSKLLSHFALIYYMVKTSFHLYSMGLHTEIHVVACVQIKDRGPPWGLLSMGATVLDRNKRAFFNSL